MKVRKRIQGMYFYFCQCFGSVFVALYILLFIFIEWTINWQCQLKQLVYLILRADLWLAVWYWKYGLLTLKSYTKTSFHSILESNWTLVKSTFIICLLHCWILNIFFHLHIIGVFSFKLLVILFVLLFEEVLINQWVFVSVST